MRGKNEQNKNLKRYTFKNLRLSEYNRVKSVLFKKKKELNLLLLRIKNNIKTELRAFFRKINLT